MYKKKLTELNNSLDQVLENLGDLDRFSKEVIDLVVKDVLSKFHHKLGAGVEDSVSDLLDNFKQKVVDRVIEDSDEWKIPQSEFVIFPRNSRFLFQKGKSTIVVIEQDPTYRTLKLDKSLYSSMGTETTERFRLPLPYSVFVIHIKDQAVVNFSIGWRTTPLRSLDDILNAPCLPNLHANSEVCWGSGNKPTFSNEDSIAEICECSIASFWSSDFNRDLRTHWDHRKKISNFLISPKKWKTKDEIFMLSLDYTCQSTDYTIRDKINQMEGFSEEPDMDRNRQRLVELVDNQSDILFSKMINYFKRVKPDRFCPKSITDDLNNILKDCFQDYEDIYKSLKTEYRNLNRLIKKEERPVRKMSSNWSEV